MSKVQVYGSSTSGNQEIKKQQQRIEMILTSKGIDFETIDISSVPDAKEKMREIVGNPQALPPQICKGDTYCGNYEAFDNAVEMEELDAFLKL